MRARIFALIDSIWWKEFLWECYTVEPTVTDFNKKPKMTFSRLFCTDFKLFFCSKNKSWHKNLSAASKIQNNIQSPLISSRFQSVFKGSKLSNSSVSPQAYPSSRMEFWAVPISCNRAEKSPSDWSVKHGRSLRSSVYTVISSLFIDPTQR